MDLNKVDIKDLKNILKNYVDICDKEAVNNFLLFVKQMWPDFINGSHHTKVAQKFEDIATGRLKRLIVNMPPRHTKSEFASFLFPAWLIGRNPKFKIIQTTHTAELAYRFGRKVRDLIDTPEYQRVFPFAGLHPDSKAAGRWDTKQGGEYFASGVGGAITGRGADLLIIDDPHSEQDALSATAFDNAYEWYTSGPRQRLQPGGAIVIVMTRWSVKDLTGKLIQAQTEPKADKWEVIEFPAIMPSGKAVWPEYWNVKELESVKASVALSKWNAQFQQQPTAEEGSIIKREWWKVWEKKELPTTNYIIQSYDTAFSKKETADFSAITTWGVFYPDEVTPNLILLDATRGRWDFPELKQVAQEEYKYWEPEMVIVEAKASGMPLTHELRRMGIPVVNFVPSKGNDKHSRVNSVAPVFESGAIWAPPRKYAEEVIEECAAFPFGENDDLVDSMTQAVMRFRQGGFIPIDSDEEEKESELKKREYY